MDGEKAHTDAILRARMREAHCTHAHQVATERVAETEATLRETEKLLNESLRDCDFGAEAETEKAALEHLRRASANKTHLYDAKQSPVGHATTASTGASKCSKVKRFGGMLS